LDLIVGHAIRLFPAVGEATAALVVSFCYQLRNILVDSNAIGV